MFLIFVATSSQAIVQELAVDKVPACSLLSLSFFFSSSVADSCVRTHNLVDVMLQCFGRFCMGKR